MRKRRILIEHYLVAFTCFSFYFLAFTIDRKVMTIVGHEFEISGWDFVLTCAIHFLIPVIILFLDKKQMIDSSSRIFKRQFRVISIALILIAIITFDTFESTYRFTSLFLLNGYYILRIISYILILNLIFKSIKLTIIIKRNEPSNKSVY